MTQTTDPAQGELFICEIAAHEHEEGIYWRQAEQQVDAGRR